LKRIYLDWNATAPMLPEAREAMIEALGGVHGNASSVHHEGQVARTVIERARRAVAAAVGAPAQAVILTGGATESNNQVLRHHIRATGQPALVCTAVEHPSVLEVVRELELGEVPCTVWPVDSQGRLDLEWLRARFERSTEPRPTLISVMWANNEIGNIYPIAEIAELVHEFGALLHVDATQALGRAPLDFEAAGVDIMTLSFHKMGGPKGIGAIVAREGLKVEATLAGGHQERGRRPGTENVPAAAGLSGALGALAGQGAAWRDALAQKRALFLAALAEHAGEFTLRGDLENCLPNTLNVAFEDVDGEDLLIALDLEGVSASSGSACTAGSLEPSHVVLAMGFEHDDARRSVRFSFGPSTEDADLVEAARRVGALAGRLGALK
jgi:cysteine desulfurase